MIARQCIADLLAAGFSITVNDGEEDTLLKSRDPDAILAAMATTDDDFLMVSRLRKGQKEAGWVRFVYGNAGPDVIHDHTNNLESVLHDTFVLANKLDEGGADEVIKLFRERDTATKELASLRLSVRRIAEVLG